MPASNLSMKMEEVRGSDSGDVKSKGINSRVKMNTLFREITMGFMPPMSRRSFLGSLTFGSIYPNVERAAGSQLEAAEGRAHTNDIRWSIAKQSSVAKLNHVD